MHKKLMELRPGLVNRKGPILLHDNARAHVSQMTLKKLNELGYETLPHLAYSPDLSPTDYHLFRHIDNFLKEKIFKSQRDAENAFKEFIDFGTAEFYATGINKLAQHVGESVLILIELISIKTVKYSLRYCIFKFVRKKQQNFFNNPIILGF